MNDFKKKGGFGGDKRHGGFPKKDGHTFSRPSFGGKPKFGGGGPKPYGRPMEMFQATCASCGKTCEVPFKPNGMKPVYCKECFDKNGGNDGAPRGGNDRFPRKDFSRPTFQKPSFNKPDFRQDRQDTRSDSRPVGDNGMGEVKKQLESLNYKMDKLITLLSDNAQKVERGPTTKAETPKKMEKKPLKKAVSKKKK